MSATIRSPRFPLSPSTPSESDSQHRAKPAPSHPAPHSPVSPSFMSVATKSYVSSYGNNQHTDEMAQRPSPRSSTENYIQHNPKMNSYQEGSLKRPNQEEDEQRRDKRQKIDAAQSDRMDVDNSIISTNHDRLEITSDDRKSEGVNQQNQTSKDDFGEPFLLCKTSVPRSRPDPQQHLLATYGLLPLLKTVARNDPESGEKINKLRKSYEGQIKTFGLWGRNKPVKCDREDDEPGPLRILATVSEQEWDEGEGGSKIEVTSDFRSTLEKAMQLQPGTVRNNAMWEDVLGHEKPKPAGAPTPAPLSQTSRIPNGGSRPPQQQNSGAGDKRSTRGKKRSYNDDSWVGYVGFSEGDDDGDDDEHARRKRKKDSFGASSIAYQHGR